MKLWSRGFTFIELMVVVAVISILTVVIYSNFSDGTKISRDAQRKADLKNLQNAVELYKNKNGRYPEGCNSTNWSGEQGSADECADGSRDYVLGLSPDYIPVLPSDPKTDGSNSGYMYVTNANGTVYKFIAMNTVEAEIVDWDSEMRSCDYVDNVSSGWEVCTASSIPPVVFTDGNAVDYCDASICRSIDGSGGNPPSQCQETNSRFQNSYGVWGGFADPNDWTGPNATPDNERIERLTEDIVCK